MAKKVDTARILNFMRAGNWTKYTFAVDKEGYSINCRNRLAVKWCLEGYVIKLYESKKRSWVRNSLTSVIRSLYPRQIYDMFSFNDSIRTTFKDVKKVVELAKV